MRNQADACVVASHLAFLAGGVVEWGGDLSIVGETDGAPKAEEEENLLERVSSFFGGKDKDKKKGGDKASGGGGGGNGAGEGDGDGDGGMSQRQLFALLSSRIFLNVNHAFSTPALAF